MISASEPFTEVMDSFCTAMASTQLSHSSPTGRRLAERRNPRDPDTLSKECLLSMKNNNSDTYV